MKAFHTIDLDLDCKISKNEIKHLLQTQGYYNIPDNQINIMIESIDFDQSGDITFDEFYLAFSELILNDNNIENSNIIESITSEWISFCNIDIGTDLSVQSSLINNDIDPKQQKSFINICKPFLSGAIGGIFSRTLTSPLERIKILAQTGTLNYKVEFIA